MTDKILEGEELIEKKKLFQKIKTDESGWNTWYIDENFNKWIEEYPNSELHGGGSPQLRLIAKFPWE
ncbi:Imm27 family immunity protein [Flavobacterium sp. ACAM 123]|jgi:hypothetical protein|uniref:Imm27 family immunity protein n=1 Tax=Flavobacterium sp. ACAM 123 TaxID=1189620 RepID=UPI0003010A13|nr:Imm27 family immunity protein [Flavobacterium sp. ACAM 123]